ncbi:MAG: type I restriction endonuclease subunit S [Rickettsiales bacterium]|nr:type I restriction endonuclease subunit S [Rickettsiales bacterium]
MKEQKKVPELRFPEFCKRLSLFNFDEVYSFVQTNSLSRSKLNYEIGNIKNIHYGDIHTKFHHHFDAYNEDVPFVNPDVDLTNVSKENYCRVGDLIIADASEDYKDIGKAIEIIKLAEHKVLAGLHTYIARSKKRQVAIGFGALLMQTFFIRRQIMRYATGASVLGISKGNLSKIELALPQLEEQEKIAEFLSVVDLKLEKLKEKKELLEDYKKGVMQKIFSQEIRFKDDNGNDYPDWEKKKMGQVCDITTGSLDANAMAENGQYPFFTCAREVYKIDIAAFDTEALLISGNGANVGYIHYYNGQFNAYQRTYVLSSFKQSIQFIKQYLCKNLRKRIFSEVKEGNTPYIVKSTLSEMPISFPPAYEQQKIADFLSSIDEKIEKLSDQIEQAEQFKKGLLQKMFV